MIKDKMDDIHPPASCIPESNPLVSSLNRTRCRSSVDLDSHETLADLSS